MPISEYLANALLQNVFGSDAYTPPDNIYVALTTTFVEPTMTGSTITEPGSGYARVECDLWLTAAGGQTYNNESVTFPQATGSWGTCVNVAILDADSGGNLLDYGPLLPAQTVVATTPPLSFAVGSIVVDGGAG